MPIGSYYFEISWIQGARFPNENEHTELRKNSFEGIDDYDALEKAYNYAIASYNVS